VIPNAALADFAAGPRYLNTATVGIPPRAAVRAVRRCLDEWERGELDPYRFDDAVARSRTAYARIAGCAAADVGIVGQVSVASGMVARSLADGATVLCAREDFTSVLFPFLADQRLQVRLVPLDELLDHIDGSIDLVAVSAVQSSDGRVLDLDRLATVAAANGTHTYVDVTQGAGWLRLDAGRFDVTACGAYKWLCAPRGTGFVTVRRDATWVQPVHAGWYSSEHPWESIYEPPLRLAGDARRFNVSPAWFGYAGAAESLEALGRIGVEALGRHSVGLADRFRNALGIEETTGAIVSMATPRGDELTADGFAIAGRAGKIRLSFYLYNTAADVDRAVAILSGQVVS
jgi:selenocysteine lyase/cysteine desulfurase